MTHKRYKPVIDTEEFRDKIIKKRYKKITIEHQGENKNLLTLGDEEVIQIDNLDAMLARDVISCFFSGVPVEYSNPEEKVEHDLEYERTLKENKTIYSLLK